MLNLYILILYIVIHTRIYRVFRHKRTNVYASAYSMKTHSLVEHE